MRTDCGRTAGLPRCDGDEQGQRLTGRPSSSAGTPGVQAPKEAEALLRVVNLGRRAPRPEGGSTWLLRGVTFTLRSGESLAIAGPSGAGKSTLLRTLAGLDPLDEGTIAFAGREFGTYAMPFYRSRVIYLHQRPVVEGGSVEEVLRRPFSLRVHREKRFDPAVVARYLERFGRDPSSFLRRSSTELSGGEQQLVALLRAIELDPAVLLLDEPAAALDPESTLALEGLVEAWRQEGEGRACVWVTHDPAQRVRVADRSLTLRGGRLAESGGPR